MPKSMSQNRSDPSQVCLGSKPTLISTLILTGCESIHLEAVLVPQYRYRGSNASLLCKYELEPNEELFSLKWYKEDTEFYRHTPPDPLSQPPPMTTYGQFHKDFSTLKIFVLKIVILEGFQDNHILGSTCFLVAS